VSFAIEDPFSPDNSGTYHLEAGPQGATCRRDGSDPDLALRVDDLGATYLGGVSFRTLARAGRVEEHTAGAIRRADALFATETAPWCANEF
jgi:predicted acetyltransferase